MPKQSEPKEYRIPCHDKRYSVELPHMRFFRGLTGDAVVRLETSEARTVLGCGVTLPNGNTLLEGSFVGFVLAGDELKLRLRPTGEKPVILTRGLLVGKPVLIGDPVVDRRRAQSRKAVLAQAITPL